MADTSKDFRVKTNVNGEEKKKQKGEKSRAKFKPSSGKQRGRRIKRAIRLSTKKIARWAKKGGTGRWKTFGLEMHVEQLKEDFKRVG